MQIYLASKSPRRQQLLEQINVPFVSIDIDIDEYWDRKEQPKAYVERMATEKAAAGFQYLDEAANAIVIGADTAVVIDDQVLGKAENPEQAEDMLRILSGRMHHVYSAVAIVGEQLRQVSSSITAVCLKPLSQEEITDYCRFGEGTGKAGGYAIQGMAGVFVESIQGSYSGVVGLPLFETYGLLRPYLD